MSSKTKQTGINAKYDREQDVLRLSFPLKSNVGFEIANPRRIIHGIENATDEALADVDMDGKGSIVWRTAGVSIKLFAFLDLFLGPGVSERLAWQALGQHGGSAKSPTKAESSRRNGKLGGRPRKAA